jgi:hypothetical protein
MKRMILALGMVSLVPAFAAAGASIRYADGNMHPFISYVLPFKLGEAIPAHVVIAGVDGTF